MKPHPDARMPRQTFHERQIGMLERTFHHIIEIPDGLVRVNQQD
jgi:hypothetical protein